MRSISKEIKEVKQIDLGKLQEQEIFIKKTAAEKLFLTRQNTTI